MTGLSRFSYLRVIARGSTAKYSSEAGDARAIGKELGARYVMEGSLRQAGPKLRLAVQLVDATTGAHLWAENYERTFSPDSVFELQDDLVPRIVSTVADMNGVLPRSMSEAVRSLSPEQLSPYEAVLRSFSYFSRVTSEELAAARTALELAIRKAPDHADALAMLALLCAQDHGQGFNLRPDSLPAGLTAARRAVEAAPVECSRPFQPRPGAFLPKGISELPERGRASGRVESHGRQLHRFSRRAVDLRGRRETRSRAGVARQATQPESSRLVLVCRLLTTRTAGATTVPRSGSCSRPTFRATGGSTRRSPPLRASSETATRPARP